MSWSTSAWNRPRVDQNNRSSNQGNNQYRFGSGLNASVWTTTKNQNINSSSGGYKYYSTPFSTSGSNQTSFLNKGGGGFSSLAGDSPKEAPQTEKPIPSNNPFLKTTPGSNQAPAGFGKPKYNPIPPPAEEYFTTSSHIESKTPHIPKQKEEEEEPAKPTNPFAFAFHKKESQIEKDTPKFSFNAQEKTEKASDEKPTSTTGKFDQSSENTAKFVFNKPDQNSDEKEPPQTEKPRSVNNPFLISSQGFDQPTTTFGKPKYNPIPPPPDEYFTTSSHIESSQPSAIKQEVEKPVKPTSPFTNRNKEIQIEKAEPKFLFNTKEKTEKSSDENKTEKPKFSFNSKKSENLVPNKIEQQTDEKSTLTSKNTEKLSDEKPTLTAKFDSHKPDQSNELKLPFSTHKPSESAIKNTSDSHSDWSASKSTQKVKPASETRIDDEVVSAVCSTLKLDGLTHEQSLQITEKLDSIYEKRGKDSNDTSTYKFNEGSKKRETKKRRNQKKQKVNPYFNQFGNSFYQQPPCNQEQFLYQQWYQLMQIGYMREIQFNMFMQQQQELMMDIAGRKSIKSSVKQKSKKRKSHK